MTMGSGSPIDHDAIRAAVTVFQKRLVDCVQTVRYKNSRTGSYVTSPISPREARVTISPGITQKGGYFDIQWWQNGDYKYHYREQDLEFRFGCEADNATTSYPVRHFHPPSDPSQHHPSCIGPDHPPERVTLAVIACWFAAAEAGDPSLLNSQTNPP
jgi:hypothetical protein